MIIKNSLKIWKERMYVFHKIIFNFYIFEKWQTRFFHQASFFVQSNVILKEVKEITKLSIVTKKITETSTKRQKQYKEIQTIKQLFKMLFTFLIFKQTTNSLFFILLKSLKIPKPKLCTFLCSYKIILELIFTEWQVILGQKKLRQFVQYYSQTIL